MKIGIIGGGQLAQMLALAAYPLGIEVQCYESKMDCPASRVAQVILGEFTDFEALLNFASQVDVLTYEFENIPLTSLEYIHNQKQDLPIYPNIKALQIAQDRWNEKQFFEKLGIPTTQYMAVDSFMALQFAIEKIELPVVFKTRTLGYDGKGQCIIRTKPDIEKAWQMLEANQSFIVENLVDFECEVSSIAVRSIDGSIVFYPLTENRHENGILRLSELSAAGTRIERLAQEYMEKILEELNYVGVLAVEFFQKHGQLFANEMAPRVHNSGHWTIEGAHISQFENHIRAISGLPLGSTATKGKTAMVNFIGNIPNATEILKIPEVHYHHYGKQPQPGRKLGHATLCLQDEALYAERLKQLIQLAV